MMTLR